MFSHALDPNAILIRHPLPMLFLVAAGLTGVLTFVPSLSQAIRRRRSLTACWFLIGLVAIAFCLIAAANLSTHLFLDHVEPNVIGISWMFATGHPVYHTTDSAVRYSQLYGPDLFAIYAALIKLTGESIIGLKAAVIAMLLASFAMMFAGYQKVAGRSIALLATGYALVAVAFYADLPLWVRADAPILLLTAIALLIGLRTGPIVGAILMGAVVGVVFNIKAHTPAYFLGLWCLYPSRWKPASLVTAAVTFAIVVAAPFLLLPQVSLTNYLAWLHEAGKHGLAIGTMLRNVEILLVLGSPAIIAALILAHHAPESFREWRRRHITFLVGTALGMTMVVIVGSKPGAGPWHLIPFVVSIGYMVATLSQRIVDSPPDVVQMIREPASIRILPQATLGALAVIVLVQIGVRLNVIRTLFEQFDDHAVVANLRQIMADHPNADLMMGVGEFDSYELSFYRPMLLFRGNPYLIDFAAIMDMDLSGLPIPAATDAAVVDNQKAVWLIPHGETPFALTSIYKLGIDAFDPTFRRLFLKNYRLVSTKGQFDLWEHVDAVRDPSSAITSMSQEAASR